VRLPKAPAASESLDGSEPDQREAKKSVRSAWHSASRMPLRTSSR
jgi:hypothetical protein